MHRSGDVEAAGERPGSSPSRRRHLAAAVAALALVAAGCSSSDAGGPGTADRPATTTTAPARPDGPAARITPLTGGAGIRLVSPQAGPDLAAAGYTETEYTASGTARAYAAVGELPADGRFTLKTTTSAPYETRIVVRRPKADADFNGTAVVEWLNVSSGADVAPDWTYMAEEIVRSGYAWVGVSAQRIGVEGGPVLVETPASDQLGAGKGIKHLDPARYGALHHPGDAYSYDLYTQVARALRFDGASNPLHDLRVRRLLAVGESQSAVTLTTYADGVQPLTRAFDGFLIHSRAGAAAPLGEPDKGIDLATSLGNQVARIRTDLDVPVLTVETESDVLGLLGFVRARQPDSARFRLWEIAGTAHADTYQLGAAVDLVDCGEPINDGQQVFVLRAALHALGAWVARGVAAPKAPRLETVGSGDGASYATDDVGNVTGGVRTPAVDAATDVLSGLPAPGSSLFCQLMGHTEPVPANQLAATYRNRAAYLSAYEQALGHALAVGYLLPADRDEILADAHPERFPA